MDLLSHNSWRVTRIIALFEYRAQDGCDDLPGLPKYV
jgi:hypothetical protein